MIKHLFVVTSAVNSKFGIYKPAERTEQTIATLTNIRERVPGCKIVVMECGGTPPTQEQLKLLSDHADLVLNYSTDPDVQAIYISDNWDLVKNSTEIMCFARALRDCVELGILADVDRVHKMSGRYVLNNDFNLSVYEQYADRIVIGPKYKSQFPFEVTGIELQYMARLWSWPIAQNDRVIKVYDDSLEYIGQRVAQGGYADIEHVLYKFLPPELVQEIPLLGVEGSIAPNGAGIKN